jgi:hypothetical protein
LGYSTVTEQLDREGSDRVHIAFPEVLDRLPRSLRVRAQVGHPDRVVIELRDVAVLEIFDQTYNDEFDRFSIATEQATLDGLEELPEMLGVTGPQPIGQKPRNGGHLGIPQTAAYGIGIVLNEHRFELGPALL